MSTTRRSTAYITSMRNIYVIWKFRFENMRNCVPVLCEISKNAHFLRIAKFQPNGHEVAFVKISYFAKCYGISQKNFLQKFMTKNYRYMNFYNITNCNCFENSHRWLNTLWPFMADFRDICFKTFAPKICEMWPNIMWMRILFLFTNELCLFFYAKFDANLCKILHIFWLLCIRSLLSVFQKSDFVPYQPLLSQILHIFLILQNFLLKCAVTFFLLNKVKNYSS